MNAHSVGRGNRKKRLGHGPLGARNRKAGIKLRVQMRTAFGITLRTDAGHRQ
jgi:hypothetical protein